MESEESVGPEAGSVEPEMESAERDFFPDKVWNTIPKLVLSTVLIVGHTLTQSNLHATNEY